MNVHKNVEEKLQRLEELLIDWRKESEQAGIKAEARIRRMTIRIVCIVFGVVGSLWSAVEFGDWYLQKRAISNMAENYIKVAEENFQRTGDVNTAFRMTQKAKELDPENPTIQYAYVYFKSQQLLQALRQITRPLNADEISRINETFAEIEILKKQGKRTNEVFVLEAQLLFLQKKLNEAESAINAALAQTKSPRPEWLILHLDIIVTQKKSKDAEEICQRICDCYPNSNWSFYAQGLMAYTGRNYKSAQEKFMDAVKLAPDMADAWQYLASAAFNTLPHDLHTTRTAAEKVIELRPGASGQAYALLSQAYLNEGNNEIALAFSEKGISLFPDYLDLRRTKIDALLALKRYDEALQENCCIRRLMPDNLAAAQKEVDIYLSMADLQHAYQSTRQFALLAGRDSSAPMKNNAAWRLFLLGKDYDTALSLIDASLEKRSSASALDTKCWILFRMKKNEALASAMEECLKSAADLGHKGKMLALQAQLLIEKGDFPQAKQKIDQSVMLYPQNPLLYLARAEYNISTGHLEDAEKEISAGLKIASTERDRASLHWAYAQLYAKQKKYGATLKELEIVNQNTNTGYLEVQPFYELYADMLFHLGQYKKAKVVSQKVLEYAPENKRVQDIHRKIIGCLPNEKE